jgi:integrase
MKTTLNQNIVLRLTLDKKPHSIVNGKLELTDNVGEKPYILFDDHRDAPTGFGLKIAKTKKTFIIQRRLPDGKVIKAKVGNVSDFPNIEDARDKARSLVQVAKETGKNPNSIEKKRLASEITLSDAFSQYREFLLGRPLPATANTLAVLDRSIKKFDHWKNRKVKDLSGNEICQMFDGIAATKRTTAEQTFRWAHSAVSHAIEIEIHEAASQQRNPALTYNPFSILKVKEKYRTRSQLEATYRAKGVRKPLSIKDTMGLWLNAINGRRSKNRSGCDYLLLSTLWGTRKNEGANLKWRHLINDAETATSSYIDLEERTVYFRDTKNREDHELPLTDAAYEILLQRKHLNKKDKNAKWVFPAESKFSKTGHYSDASSLIEYICEDAGIQKIGMHDLRRTMGRIAEELTSYAMVKRVLNHSSLSDPTSRYTETEWERLKEVLQRIELHILATAPVVFNILLTPKYAMMPIAKLEYPS